MCPLKVIFGIFLAYQLCSVGNSAIMVSKGELQLPITNEYKYSSMETGQLKLNCGRFKNDYAVLHQFPFQILINPVNETYERSTAIMDNDGFVTSIYIYQEKIVPPSIFCLLKLEKLHISKTSFLKGIVPDDIRNLKKLKYLWIYDSPTVSVTDQINVLSNLLMLTMNNCSLTSFPNVNNLSRLWTIDLSVNQLSKLGTVTGVIFVDLCHNLFTGIPDMIKKENILHLDLSSNPLKNIESITSYINLQSAFFKNVTLQQIPADFDKLSKLTYIDFSNNNLSNIPQNILNLRDLEVFDIQDNMISRENIQVLKKAFEDLRPNTQLRT